MITMCLREEDNESQTFRARGRSSDICRSVADAFTSLHEMRKGGVCGAVHDAGWIRLLLTSEGYDVAIVVKEMFV